MMHAKQHRAMSARAAFYAIFSASVAPMVGCAVLANLGGNGEANDDGSAPGSKIPDRAEVTPQGEGGPPAAPLVTCATNLASDPANCGWCGHACAGAACTAGLCAPTTIVASDSIERLVVDEDRVVYTTADDVQTCPASPAASCTKLVDGATVLNATRAGSGVPLVGAGAAPKLHPAGLALAGDRVLLLDDTNEVVVVCPKASCVATSIGIARIAWSVDFTGGLSAGDGRIEWGESNGMGEADLPPPAGRTDSRFISGPVLNNVARVTIAQLGGRSEVVLRARAGLFTLPTTGTVVAPTEVLASTDLRDFAVDPRFVYAATKDTVVRIDRATHASSPFATVVGAEITQVVADAAGMYAATNGEKGERVVRVREGGVDTIASTSHIRGIAVSTKWLYIASNGAIRRVPR